MDDDFGLQAGAPLGTLVDCATQACAPLRSMVEIGRRIIGIGTSKPLRASIGTSPHGRCLIGQQAHVKGSAHCAKMNLTGHGVIVDEFIEDGALWFGICFHGDQSHVREVEARRVSLQPG